MALVTVFNTFSPVQAQLIRSLLEAAELHPSVLHELSALSTEGYALSTGGVGVQVPEEEAEDARLLIAGEPEQ
jgi:hypothetical protein